MAKFINTTIALKSDWSANWDNSNLIALNGEYLFDSQRGYIKVGDGVHTWKDLKTIRLPKDAIDGLQDVDTNTIYSFSPVSGNTIKLLSADGTVTPIDWKEASTFKIDLSAEISAIADAYTKIEKARAEGVEATLTQAIADNTAAIGAEVDRATGAEEALQTAITAEETRAKGEEKTLSGLIAAEETRAKSEEKTLSSLIAAAFAAEETRATAAEAANAAAIAAEETRATAAEQTLQGNIDALSTCADTTFETKEDATAKYNELTGKIDAETTAREEADVALETKLSVTVEKQETAEGTYLATYYVKQNGVKVGDSINIPKDFVVKTATVKVCEKDDEPASGLKIGDKYIDLEINTKDESETTTHIYLPIKDMVDAYIGAETTTAKVTIGNDNTISAEVRDGSLSYNKLSSDVTDKFDSLDATDEALRTDVNKVSVDLTAEVARATAAEAANAAAITAETEAREQADSDLTDYINSVSADLSTDYVKKIDNAAEVTKSYIDGVAGDLSTDYVAKIGEETTRATQVETGLRTDINTVSTDLDTLEATAVKSIKLNGDSFDVANNEATFEISAIFCGGAK